MILRLLLLSFATPTFGENRTVTYEPAVIELAGRLDLQTFPGPPNYESIRKGDEAERNLYLKLDNSIDVLPKGSHPIIDNPEPERNVEPPRPKGRGFKGAGGARQRFFLGS
jgi:hypothetical protein